MDQTTKPAAPATDDETYEPPRLDEAGDFNDLTQGAIGTSSDGTLLQSI